MKSPLSDFFRKLSLGVPCSEYCLYLCLMYFTVCDSLFSIKFQLFEFSESRKKHFHFYDFQRSFTLTFSSDSLFACSWVILFSLSFRSCQSTKTRVTECSLSCFENRVFLYVTMGATEREDPRWLIPVTSHAFWRST